MTSYSTILSFLLFLFPGQFVKTDLCEESQEKPATEGATAEESLYVPAVIYLDADSFSLFETEVRVEEKEENFPKQTLIIKR